MDIWSTWHANKMHFVVSKAVGDTITPSIGERKPQNYSMDDFRDLMDGLWVWTGKVENGQEVYEFVDEES